MNKNPYTQSPEPPKMLKSFVCFADILGYSHMSNEALKAGHGEKFLQQIHRSLSTAYERVRKYSNMGLSDEAAYAIKIFTDNIVVGYPIDQQGYGKGEPELANIFRVFSDLQVALGMDGFFLRGGISYGDHYMDDDIVFGEALLEAHGLDKGGWPPRLTIAPSAIRIVQEHLGFYNPPSYAPHYTNLLEDADGAIFLNYLERAFMAFPEGGVFFDVVERHQQSIKKGLEKYRGEPGIRAKYEWAARYHNFVCEEFVARHPVPSDPDTDGLYAAAAQEAQELLDYRLDVESLAAKPCRMTLDPIRP